MRIIKTELSGSFIIENDVFKDNRGSFFESYSKKKLENENIFIDFVQDNQSFNAKAGTVRGLHFQNNPYAQGKLIRCITGAILDIAVDLRIDSPTYKKWISVELNEENKKELFVPKGFAHGFITLQDNSIVSYKIDEYYLPEYDDGIIWNDPEINVNWNWSDDVILSEKDKNLPLFCDSFSNFKMEQL